MRRIARAAILFLAGLAGAGVLLAIVSVWGAGLDWTLERLGTRVGELRAQAHSVALPASRWWRCRGSERPLLGSGSAPWTLEYSWTEGFGAGNVHLKLSSDGAVELRVVPHKGEERFTHARASGEEVMGIAGEIDDVGFLCLESRPRADHHVADLGTYRVVVASEGYGKEVTAGTCEFVDDADAFNAVLSRIGELAPLVGDELVWGPYGSTTLKGPCAEEPA